jgi:hypothetical protein
MLHMTKLPVWYAEEIPHFLNDTNFWWHDIGLSLFATDNKPWHILNTTLLIRKGINRIQVRFNFVNWYACTKSGALRFSQFSGFWLVLSVYIIMSFDFPFVVFRLVPPVLPISLDWIELFSNLYCMTFLQFPIKGNCILVWICMQ